MTDLLIDLVGDQALGAQAAVLKGDCILENAGNLRERVLDTPLLTHR